MRADFPKKQPRTERPPAGATTASPIYLQRPLAIDAANKIPAVFLGFSPRHPLIYRKRIAKHDPARPGDMVAVYGPARELLGYALYNSHSEIGARMIFSGPQLPDDALWQRKLEDALSLRRDLLQLDAAATAYRLIHAEADGLSGLVVDRYADVLSAEAFSLGMYQRAAAILDRLAQLCGTKHTLIRPSPQFLSQEGYQPPDVASPGLPDRVTVKEYGTRFYVRFAGGHKTGFFCDQRENRKRLAEFCQDRTVLDLCCYTGGFAVQAKRLGNAREVTGVDLDQEPLQLARENANLNQARVRFVEADAFNYMRDVLQTGRQYDVVVLDPPKLIRSRLEHEEGKRKHFDLNRLAMRLVKPGGLMLSCTCSGLLSEDDFLGLLHAAARQAGPLIASGATGASGAAGGSAVKGATGGSSASASDAGGSASQSERHASRSLQILARTGAAADHPVAAGVPESEYLKAVWMRLG
jgi:23S rRNA (cytosine1962-C5)-methyltransferase